MQGILFRHAQATSEFPAVQPQGLVPEEGRRKNPAKPICHQRFDLLQHQKMGQISRNSFGDQMKFQFANFKRIDFLFIFGFLCEIEIFVTKYQIKYCLSNNIRQFDMFIFL